jgi:hypothetical protein
MEVRAHMDRASLLYLDGLYGKLVLTVPNEYWSKVIFMSCSYIHFEHRVLNPGTVASV